MNTEPLSPDAQVTLLLCSHLALPRGRAAGGLKPLSPGEWNDLADRLKGLGLRPRELLSMDEAAMITKLGLPAEPAQRIRLLLGRGAQLALEVERLSSLGIWTLTRSDAAYPSTLKKRLGTGAPPVLFGAGDRSLLTRGFLAVVGSRAVDEAGEQFASAIGAACARQHLVLVSGGARGVDRISMGACLQGSGTAIGVLADSLERAVRQPEYRSAAVDGRLVLLSAVHPKAPFSVASAMARNKLIYCLAQYGLVVASSEEKGGTRAGALEVLKHRWVPLFVRDGQEALPGNLDLIKRGALPFPAQIPEGELAGWLADHATSWGAAAPVSRKAPTGRKAAVDDLFPLVWPHIQSRLQEAGSLAELAQRLRVEERQLQLWLQRAVQEGRVSPSDGSVKRILEGTAAGDQMQFEV